MNSRHRWLSAVVPRPVTEGELLTRRLVVDLLRTTTTRCPA
jgi:hypothetical protein